jgi:hypothetical protein
MLALKILGIIALFLIFILSIKATVIISYSDEVALSLKLLGIKIRILPKKEKNKGPHSMSRRKALSIRKKLEEKKNE